MRQQQMRDEQLQQERLQQLQMQEVQLQPKVSLAVVERRVEMKDVPQEQKGDALNRTVELPAELQVERQRTVEICAPPNRTTSADQVGKNSARRFLNAEIGKVSSTPPLPAAFHG